MALNKKGITAQQFHWIFVLVAGAVILIFFITVISSVKTTSDNKLSVSVVQSFDTIFAGAKASDNTVTIIPAPPQTTIEYVCDISGYSEFAVADSIASRQNANRIIFAPATISGRQFVVFTRSIDIPFKVDNALFISDLGTRYMIVENDAACPGCANRVFNLLPSNISKQLVTSWRNIDVTKVERVVVVHFDHVDNDIPPEQQADLQEIEYMIVRVAPDEVVDSDRMFRSGSLRFRAKERVDRVWQISDEKITYYFGPTLLLGGIFAQDDTYYECAIKKFYDKMNVVAQLYQKRTEILYAETSSKPVCQLSYDDAIDAFEEISLVTTTNVVNNQLTSQKIQELIVPSADLFAANKEVELKSCPLIY